MAGVLKHRRGTLNLQRPALMAILNLTPDSFSDGGKLSSVDTTLRWAEACIEAGADILDLGAESTRPGASPVDEWTEAERLLPALEAVRTRFEIPLSVDTWRATTAHRALEAGADLINDVGGGRWDPQMANVVAHHRAGWILMHAPPSRARMHEALEGDDIVGQIHQFWEAAVTRAIDAGVPAEAIAVDPGFGFGMDATTNHRVFRSLPTLAAFGRPVLVGISRKRMLRALSGTDPETLEHATTAAHTLALLYGARILRTHHLGAARAARAVWETLQHDPAETGPRPWT